MAKSRDPLAPPPGPSPSRRDSSEIVEAVVAAALAIGDPQTSVNTIAARAVMVHTASKLPARVLRYSTPRWPTEPMPTEP